MGATDVKLGLRGPRAKKGWEPLTRATKKSLLSINATSRYKIEPGAPQQTSEMQYQLFKAEFTRKINSANSVCDMITFVAYYRFLFTTGKYKLMVLEK